MAGSTFTTSLRFKFRALSSKYDFVACAAAFARALRQERSFWRSLAASFISVHKCMRWQKEHILSEHISESERELVEPKRTRSQAVRKRSGSAALGILRCQSLPSNKDNEGSGQRQSIEIKVKSWKWCIQAWCKDKNSRTKEERRYRVQGRRLWERSLRLEVLVRSLQESRGDQAAGSK